MAEKISVQIALEGGAEIERQLADIGAAGQKAFADIGKSAEQVGGFKNLKPEEVTAKLQEMGVTGVDAIGKIQAAVKSAGRLETLVAGITSVETAFAVLSQVAPVVGVAIVTAMTAATKATIGFAQSINQVNTAAQGLGIAIAQFDRLRASLEQAGLSGKGVTGTFEKLKTAADTAALEKVKKAYDDIAAGGLRIVEGVGGFSIIPQQFKTLEEAARGVGPAADFARQKLVEIGRPIPMDAPKSLKDLIIQTGDAEQGLRAFIAQVEAMPQGANRSKLAFQELGQGGAELVRMLDAGIPVSERFKQSLVGLITEEDANKAARLEGSINRLTSAAERFGSVSLAPTLTAGIDAVTGAVQKLGGELERDPWGTFATAAKAALTPVAFVAQQITDAVSGLAGKIGSIAWDAISSVGVAAWDALTAAIGRATTALTEFQTKAQKTGAGAPAAPSGNGNARGGLLGGRGTGTSDSNLAWLSRGEYVMPASAVRQPGVLSFLEALRRSGSIPGFAAGGSVPIAGIAFPGAPADKVLQALQENTSVLGRLVQTVDTLVQTVNVLGQKIDGLVQVVNALWDITKAVAQSVNDVAKRSAGQAGGGLLGGRGTGTSDSNLAWVSRGEHIMPARAVAQPGVLAFLEALRRSGGNLSAVLDGMGRFALGGMAGLGPHPAMAFAGGGLVGSQRNLGVLTLHMPDGTTVSGLTDERIAEALGRAAVKSAVRSGGRKPSRYG